jgi:uncharacterized protein YecA (UPF0149 family)
VNAPTPFEQEYTETAEVFRQVSNKEHPRIKAMSFGINRSLIILKNGQHRARETERNAICGCGSGRKYKKCCLQ